jgi:hypothetical protein
VVIFLLFSEFFEIIFPRETEEYYKESTHRLKVVLITEEWGDKVRGWRSQLGRAETAIDEHDVGRGQCYSVNAVNNATVEIEQALAVLFSSSSLPTLISPTLPTS